MSNVTRTIRSVLLFAALVSVGIAPPACQKKEPPPPPAPLPPPPPPLPPARVPAALLDDVVDAAAAHLARALSDWPAVRSASKKQVLALAPLKAEGGVNDDRFASAVQSLHGRLQQIPDLNENFAFVATSVDDARDLLARESDPTGFADPLDTRNLQQGRPARYAPNSIYVLTGRYSQAGRSSDGDVRYRLVVEVKHPADRTLVTSKAFQSTLAWNDDAAEWVVVED